MQVPEQVMEPEKEKMDIDDGDDDDDDDDDDDVSEEDQNLSEKIGPSDRSYVVVSAAESSAMYVTQLLMPCNVCCCLLLFHF